jgi:hypothetical protein
MADIFISYRSLRRPAIEHLSRALEAHGYSVWFDYALLSGVQFEPIIQRELRAAEAVIVVWCSLSIDPNSWVREEASLAKELGTIVPVWLEQVDLPLGYRGLDTVDLSEWDGNPRGRGLDRLIDQIAKKLNKKPTPAYEQLVTLERTWLNYGQPKWRTLPLDEEVSARIESERERWVIGSSGLKSEAYTKGVNTSELEEPQLGEAKEKGERERAARLKREQELAQIAELEDKKRSDVAEAELGQTQQTEAAALANDRPLVRETAKSAFGQSGVSGRRKFWKLAAIGVACVIAISFVGSMLRPKQVSDSIPTISQVAEGFVGDWRLADVGTCEKPFRVQVSNDILSWQIRSKTENSRIIFKGDDGWVFLEGGYHFRLKPGDPNTLEAGLVAPDLKSFVAESYVKCPLTTGPQK